MLRGSTAAGRASASRDELVVVRCFAEDAPQHRDRLVEVVLLDDEIRPDRRDQRVLVERLTRVLDEMEQRIENLRLQRDRLAVRA